MKSSTFNARSPEAYEAFMGRWSRRLTEPFVKFAGVGPGERIIDIGCGTGNLTFALAEAADIAQLIGIDLSDVYLTDAQGNNRDARVSFAKGDATRIDFPDGSFDRAFSLLVLQFVPDASRAIYEMKRVVRRGGVVAAAVWDSYGGMPAQRLFWDAALHLGLASDHDLAGFFFRPMTRPGDLAAAWAAKGLSDVMQTSFTIRMDYASFDDYWRPIAAGEAALGKFAIGLEPAKLELLETCVYQSYLGGLPDGPRSFAATTWFCKGVVP